MNNNNKNNNHNDNNNYNNDNDNNNNNNNWKTNIFPNMLLNTSLDFISDMEVTDHKHYDRWYRK